MTTRSSRWIGVGGTLAVVALLSWGCAKKDEDQAAAGGPGGGAPKCDFKECGVTEGPKDALVKLVAFYPGGHEDTIAAVKGMRKVFPKEVSVEFVDWRHPEGMESRSKAGLGCAGVTINGKNTCDLKVDGKVLKVLFQRGVDTEWTADDLTAAIKQEIEALKTK